MKSNLSNDTRDLNGQLIQDMNAIESHFNATLLLYYCSEFHAKSITDEDVMPIVQFCTTLKPNSKLVVVLHANGGMVHVAHRIGQALWEHSPEVRFLVPERARSAATLLCFAGVEIQLAPWAVLGPVDPMIHTGLERTSTQVQVVSSEDVKAFAEMSASWFGVEREAFGATLLNLLCQRIFPLSLSTFYRAEKYVREVAEEFLKHQRPDASEVDRTAIIDHFLSSHASHDALIGFEEAKKAGLNITPLPTMISQQIESLLATCKSLCRPEQNVVAGVLASMNRVLVYQTLTPTTQAQNVSPDQSDESNNSFRTWQDLV